jgi:hypothetical protein
MRLFSAMAAMMAAGRNTDIFMRTGFLSLAIARKIPRTPVFLSWFWHLDLSV